MLCLAAYTPKRSCWKLLDLYHSSLHYGDYKLKDEGKNLNLVSIFSLIGL